MEGEIDYDGLSDNKECNKNESMRVRKLCSSVWVCQKDLISTYGCDMTMEIYLIPGNQ
jgi:hypothetical protein